MFQEVETEEPDASTSLDQSIRLAVDSLAKMNAETVRSVRVVFGRRLTSMELLRAQTIAQERNVRLTMDGHGIVIVRHLGIKTLAVPADGAVHPVTVISRIFSVLNRRSSALVCRRRGKVACTACRLTRRCLPRMREHVQSTNGSRCAGLGPAIGTFACSVHYSRGGPALARDYSCAVHVSPSPNTASSIAYAASSSGNRLPPSMNTKSG